MEVQNFFEKNDSSEIFSGICIKSLQAPYAMIDLEAFFQKMFDSAL